MQLMCLRNIFFFFCINTPTKPKKARCQKHISSLLAETLNSYFRQLHKCSNIKAAVPLSGGYFGLAGLIGLLQAGCVGGHLSFVLSTLRRALNLPQLTDL